MFSCILASAWLGLGIILDISTILLSSDSIHTLHYKVAIVYDVWGKVAIVYGVWGKVAIVYGVWGKVAIVYGAFKKGYT